MLNWVWQGALLVVVASGHARLSRRVPATARYRLWWFTLLGVVCLPGVSWVLGKGSLAGPDVALVMQRPVVDVPFLLTLAAPVLAAVWLCWTVLSLVRLAAALVLLRRIKRACVPLPPAREARLMHWRALAGVGRPARLAVSPAVGCAAVLGGREPVIAVSPTLLGRLTDRELDQIVLHEWAHVQRRDDTAQLLQQCVMAIFGVHPAVWWCARQLELERELACDERVVDATGSPKTYAACLVKLAEHRSRRHPVGAPAAAARTQLTTRITRLIQPQMRYGAHGSAASIGAGAAMLLVTVGLAARVPLVGALPLQLEVPRSPHRGSAATVMPAAAPPIVPALSHINSQGATTRRPVVAQLRRSGVARSSLPSPEHTDLINLTADMSSPSPARRASPVGYAGGAAELSSLPGVMVSILSPSPRPAEPLTSPWKAPAEAGVAIGRGSTKAARATAGFFTRMGKSIAGRM